MKVQGKSVPGPQFFPILVCIVLYLAATLLAIQIIRSPKVPDNGLHPGNGQFSADMLNDLGQLGQEDQESRKIAVAQARAETWKSYSDWRTVGLLLGAVVAFVLVLNPVGWIISAAMLFWIVAYALGSRRPVFDIGVGLLFSSITQLAFGAGLGLSLPAGFVGGIL
jgi:putative tricarboxylic transport membrane protein